MTKHLKKLIMFVQKNSFILPFGHCWQSPNLAYNLFLVTGNLFITSFYTLSTNSHPYRHNISHFYLIVICQKYPLWG